MLEISTCRFRSKAAGDNNAVKNSADNNTIFVVSYCGIRNQKIELINGL